MYFIKGGPFPSQMAGSSVSFKVITVGKLIECCFCNTESNTKKVLRKRMSLHGHQSAWVSAYFANLQKYWLQSFREVYHWLQNS
jgi:hypothetical protein